MRTIAVIPVETLYITRPINIVKKNIYPIGPKPDLRPGVCVLLIMCIAYLIG